MRMSYGSTQDELTAEELEEIRSRLNSATGGPWRSMVEGRDHTSGDNFIMTGPADGRGKDLYLSQGPLPASPEDQDFVASARQDIPRLLGEIERLKALVKRLQGS
jgi:hypothetical protein